MPWWGIAYCQGININDPEMTEERSRLAWEAVQEAIARIEDTSAVEAALGGREATSWSQDLDTAVV